MIIRRVLMAGFTVLCIAVVVPAYGQVGAASKELRQTARPGDACCSIVAVDRASGLVTAKVNTTGATYKFRVTDGSALAALRVGTPIYAQSSGSGESCSSNAASGSGGTKTPSSGGTTSCGSNVDRNADTRPKECVATDSAGNKHKVPCPSGM